MELRDPLTNPTSEVIATCLGNSNNAYEKFLELVSKLDINITWRYYNDGKAWLGKAEHKKKTVFWLSIWEGFFKVSFYFTEKTIEGAENAITEKLKKQQEHVANAGKLIPRIFIINSSDIIDDLSVILVYKKQLK